MNEKSIFASKTATAAFITTAAGLVSTFIPSVGEFVAANSGTILVGLGVLNFGLRLVTKSKISLFPED